VTATATVAVPLKKIQRRNSGRTLNIPHTRLDFEVIFQLRDFTAIMAESHNQNTPGAASASLPVNNPSVIDTPPIALTPGDDGSDFYNTPLTSGTPANADHAGGNAPQVPVTEPPASSNPPSLIPGLSLVNYSFKKTQAGKNDADALELSNKPEIATSQNEPATRNHAPEHSGLADTDAMEVEQENKEETVGANRDANGGASASDAVMAEPVKIGQHEEEEHPEWEIDSSPYESSSDSSDSDSSDSDDEDEDYPILSPEEQARILMQGELGSDDEGDGKGKSGSALKTANEIPEEVLPIPEITITPETKIVLLGNVEAVVDNTVLIAANVTGEYQVLEAGSLLCLEDRRVAGVVSETLGRVENPLYAVRFPTAADVEERGLSRGTVIYYVEAHSTFVFTQPLKGLKGSDASNFHDEEVAEDEVEFSDDEQEAEYRRKLKQKRQERKGARNENSNSGRGGRGGPGPSKLNQSELNYDDNAGEDGYTPLARPKNLHEMMRHEAPVENDGFSNRHSGFGGGRGRGRGSDRGRGGRGRGEGRPRDQHRSQHDRQPYHQHERHESHHQAQSQQYPTYNPSQQYPGYQPMPQPQAQPQPQQQPQQPYAHPGLPAAPFNFQMPYQQAYLQPNPYQQLPGQSQPHINPLFLAALQQQQQFQQQQQQHQQQHQQQQPYQQPQQYGQQAQQPGAAQPQAQTGQALNLEGVKAQLEILQQLRNGNQWPPRQ
jgi:H/ACA ribonucleoprotein complex non-core subunit NAF1